MSPSGMKAPCLTAASFEAKGMFSCHCDLYQVLCTCLYTFRGINEFSDFPEGAFVVRSLNTKSSNKPRSTSKETHQ